MQFECEECGFCLVNKDEAGTCKQDAKGDYICPFCGSILVITEDDNLG